MLGSCSCFLQLVVVEEVGSLLEGDFHNTHLNTESLELLKQELIKGRSKQRNPKTKITFFKQRLKL